jgi:hypothetical protein
MKNLLANSILTLLFATAIGSGVYARPVAANLTTSNSSYSTSEVSPFNLVFLAYQGYLENQGIPSAGTLIYESRRGGIDGKALVTAAVADGRLSPNVLDDDSYVSAVNAQLRALRRPTRQR